MPAPLPPQDRPGGQPIGEFGHARGFGRKHGCLTLQSRCHAFPVPVQSLSSQSHTVTHEAEIKQRTKTEKQGKNEIDWWHGLGPMAQGQSPGPGVQVMLTAAREAGQARQPAHQNVQRSGQPSHCMCMCMCDVCPTAHKAADSCGSADDGGRLGQSLAHVLCSMCHLKVNLPQSLPAQRSGRGAHAAWTAAPERSVLCTQEGGATVQQPLKACFATQLCCRLSQLTPKPLWPAATPGAVGRPLFVLHTGPRLQSALASICAAGASGDHLPTYRSLTSIQGDSLSQGTRTAPCHCIKAAVGLRHQFKSQRPP